jgi:transposase-like protein
MPKRDKNTRTFTKERLTELIRKHDGNLTAIAREADCVRQTVYASIQRYGLEEVVDEVRETLVDVAESNLHELVRERHPSAIFFYLKTIGKRRGYVERSEQTGVDGGPIRMVLDKPPRATTVEEWVGFKNRIAEAVDDSWAD